MSSANEKIGVVVIGAVVCLGAVALNYFMKKRNAKKVVKEEVVPETEAVKVQPEKDEVEEVNVESSLSFKCEGPINYNAAVSDDITATSVFENITVANGEIVEDGIKGYNGGTVCINGHTVNVGWIYLDGKCQGLVEERDNNVGSVGAILKWNSFNTTFSDAIFMNATSDNEGNIYCVGVSSFVFNEVKRRSGLVVKYNKDLNSTSVYNFNNNQTDTDFQLVSFTNGEVVCVGNMDNEQGRGICVVTLDTDLNFVSKLEKYI